jgi:Ankyrin repeats (3 copies)
VKAAHHELIELLLSRGANHDGALAVAVVYHKDPSTVQLLLRHGATDPVSYALVCAAGQNKTEMAKILLTHPNAPKRPSSSSNNALTKAASKGHLEMVLLLLDEFSFPINGRDNQGRTALFAACSADYPNAQLVQTLIDRGANINLPASNTPRKLFSFFTCPSLNLSQ